MRALQLLRDRGSLRVSELAKELSVARSTAHRLMMLLSAYGVVEPEPDSPRYHAGPLLAQLGLAAFRSRDLSEQMHPYLERLSDEVGETVHLIAIEGRDAVFIDGVESRGPALRVAARVGIILPAYVNSGGKALLAEQSDDAVRRLYAGTAFASTSRTIPSLEALIAELRETRERGYATTWGDREVGIGGRGRCAALAGGTAHRGDRHIRSRAAAPAVPARIAGEDAAGHHRPGSGPAVVSIPFSLLKHVRRSATFVL